MECVCWGNGDSYVAAGTRKGNVFLYNQLTKQTFGAFTMKQGNKVCFYFYFYLNKMFSLVQYHQ
jgi:hypothetical protein